jgi:hypothetical protein
MTSPDTSFWATCTSSNFQTTWTGGPFVSYFSTNSIPGLTFNTVTGDFDGTPTVPGVYPTDVEAQNYCGNHSSSTITLIVLEGCLSSSSSSSSSSGGGY